MVDKIIPAAPKKSVLKITELNNLFKSFPQLEDGDQSIFENDLMQIRANMNTKDQTSKLNTLNRK